MTSRYAGTKSQPAVRVTKVAPPPGKRLPPVSSSTVTPKPATKKRKPTVTGQALAVTRGKGKKKGLKRRGY